MAYWRGTTTPLEKNAEWVSQVAERGRYDYNVIDGSVYADKTGTIYIEQSGDGENWDVVTSYEIPEKEGKGFVETLVLSLWRIKYVNGGTKQGAFRINASVQMD